MAEEYDELRRRCARRYLEHVRGLGDKAAALREEIDMQRQAMQPGAIGYDGAGGKGCAYADAIPDGVARIGDMAARYAEQMRDYLDQAAEAHEVLHSLDDSKATALLTRRYVLGQTWGEIAGAMGYSVAWAYRAHDVALLDVYETMPHAWRIPRQPAI